jgi:uncharacterized DUF497 family protein
MTNYKSSSETFSFTLLYLFYHFFHIAAKNTNIFKNRERIFSLGRGEKSATIILFFSLDGHIKIVSRRCFKALKN